MADGLISEVRDYIGSDKALFEWVQTFADNLKLDNFIGELGVATDFAHALCGLFALFYVCRIVWRSWANGSQIDIYKTIKPLAIGMAIMFFGTIAGAVDFMTDTIGLATQEFSNSCSRKSEDQFVSFVNAVGGCEIVKTPEQEKKMAIDEKASENGSVKLQEEEKKEIEKGVLSRIAELLGNIVSIQPGLILEDVIKTTVWSLLQTLAVLAASITACCVLCMGFIGRCVFYFFGPFLFAMELIPGMEGRLVGWFKKYLTYSLYPCILNIVSGVLVMLMVTLSDLLVNTSFYSGHGIMMMERSGMIHFVIAAIGVFMFMSIPSVASQLMETASNELGRSGMIPVSYAAGKAGDGMASKIGTGLSSAKTAGASVVIDQAKSMGKQMSSDSNFKGGSL